MGVSIMGFATNVREEIVINSLKKTFENDNRNFDFKLSAELLFDELISTKPKDNIIDTFSSDKGTICILSHQLFDILRKEYLATFFDYTYFDISETSMSHRFALFSNGREGLCMNIWDKGNTKRIAGDNFLDINDNDDIFFISFPKAVKEFLPTDFHKIDLKNKINRYELISNVEVEKPEIKIEKKSFFKKLFG